jgi:hypothetical protein
VGQTPPEITEAFFAVYTRVLPGSVAARANDPARSIMDGFSTIFSKVEDGIRQAAAFSEPEQWRFDWEQTYTRDEWLDELPTHGDHTRLPPDKLDQVLTGIGAAIDAAGGAFTMRYTTVVVTAARISA